MQLKPTVFVVDDDEAVRESIVLLLESEDLNTEAFANAEAFLDAYNADRAGCLVLDISMPPNAEMGSPASAALQALDTVDLVAIPQGLVCFKMATVGRSNSPIR